ncbi:unnamed protein product, partial [Prorocentrum cordatum]
PWRPNRRRQSAHRPGGRLRRTMAARASALPAAAPHDYSNGDRRKAGEATAAPASDEPSPHCGARLPAPAAEGTGANAEYWQQVCRNMARSPASKPDGFASAMLYGDGVSRRCLDVKARAGAYASCGKEGPTEWLQHRSNSSESQQVVPELYGDGVVSASPCPGHAARGGCGPTSAPTPSLRPAEEGGAVPRQPL